MIWGLVRSSSDLCRLRVLVVMSEEEIKVEKQQQTGSGDPGLPLPNRKPSPYLSLGRSLPCGSGRLDAAAATKDGGGG